MDRRELVEKMTAAHVTYGMDRVLSVAIEELLGHVTPIEFSEIDLGPTRAFGANEILASRRAKLERVKTPSDTAKAVGLKMLGATFTAEDADYLINEVIRSTSLAALRTSAACSRLESHQTLLLLLPALPFSSSPSRMVERIPAPPRKDKGTKRPVKSEPGTLTGLEASKFESAVEMLIVAEARLQQYTQERDKLKAIVRGYFDSLKGAK
jgi:hypothetical protein